MNAPQRVSPCPLCTQPDCRRFHEDRTRHYLECPKCHLVFVPPTYHLSADDEKRVYDQHQNNPDDPDYRKFLSRLSDPLSGRLPPGSVGLDFGCGPGPALVHMLREAGFTMDAYDPYYFPNPNVWNRRFDFITATEVFEHLREPGIEIQRLMGLLHTDGWLGVMTKRVRDVGSFSTWHYILDPTHVAFYSEATFEWMAMNWNLSVEFPGSDTVLFQKRGI
jgi:hypothetical protein